MENGPFTDDFPIKTTIYRGFSIAMLNNQMVVIETCPRCSDVGQFEDITSISSAPSSFHLDCPILTLAGTS